MLIESSPTLLDTFKALADESRLRIVGLLTIEERSVEELAEILRLKPPTVSHHLSTLRGVGLVAMRAVGTTHLYRFQPEALHRLHRELAPERLAVLPDDLEGDAWERKVLRDFLDAQGRVPMLPATERKRRAVVKWLASFFEPDRRYSELEVNAIIAARHNDYASARRYMVDYGFMDRSGGEYWRTHAAG